MQPQSVADDSRQGTEYLPVLRLWMLRALLRCNGVRSFVRENRFADRNIAGLLGYTDEDLENYSEPWALKSLTQRLAAAEAEPATLPQAPVLARNIARLAERLSLNAVERDILHFTALQRVQPEFSELLGSVGDLTRASVCRLFAECLGVPTRDVQAALDDRGKLCRYALLSVDDARTYSFEAKIDVLQGLPESLLLEHDDLLDLFGQSVARSPAPRLTLDDYPHLAEDLAILRGYLGASCRQRRAGVNVLLHGRPGTGKTEFVRALGGVLVDVIGHTARRRRDRRWAEHGRPVQAGGAVLLPSFDPRKLFAEEGAAGSDGQFACSSGHLWGTEVRHLGDAEQEPQGGVRVVGREGRAGLRSVRPAAQGVFRCVARGTGRVGWSRCF